MLDLTKDVRSLSEFKRNSPAFLKRLRQSGSPLVLTVNGRAEVVLQDVNAYQKLCDRAGKQKEREPHE